MLILAFLFPWLLLVASGCGGGGSQPQTIQQPPPAPQDFSVTLSSNALSVPQGATSSPVNVSVNAQNGFTAAVQITLTGLPIGVLSAPSASFNVASGASAPVIFGVTTTAAVGTFTINAQGASGSLSHTATLALTVQTSVASTLPRTTYARTDALPAMDDPPGEPRHRHLVYDPANKHVFVANRAMNRVEVFSTADRTRIAQINVPAATSVDLSPDGATLWVGSLTQQITAIDTASLQVESRYAVPPASVVPGETYDRPQELLALSNGNYLLRLRKSSEAEAILALWNPVTNSVNTSTAAEPYGLGALARTGDHTKAIIATNNSDNDLAVFDSNGNILAGPLGLGNGSTPLAAANRDGSRFAVVFVSNGATQLLLLDASLNQIAAAPLNAHSVAFSREGNFLYAGQSVPGLPAIAIFDGRTLQSLGQVADASIQGVNSKIEDVDDTQLLFGLANRGVSFVDASAPVALPAIAPSFAAAPAQPSEGPSVGGTSISLAGQNFDSTPSVTFGTQLANNVTLAGATQLQAASPPNVAKGGVNITAFFPDGALAIAPDAFSYGPQILDVLPNAGVKSGGDIVQIYGYGFGGDPSKITVNIGGSNAAVQKVERATSTASSLGFDTTYPFSLERITLRTPPGTPGTADVGVTSAAGTAAVSHSFQYLQDAKVYPNLPLYKFLVYDQNRQQIYLSFTDHVDVFDLRSGVFKAQLPLACKVSSGAIVSGPCPDAGLRGMSLTPDGSQLVVADFGSRNVYLLNPDVPGQVNFVFVGGVAGSTNSGPARVAATSTHTVFVGLSDESSSPAGCNSCLAQLSLSTSPPNVQPAPQPEVTSVTGTPLLQGNAAGDHVVLAFGSSGGPVAVWNAASPNHFTTSPVSESMSDLAVAADATMFATRADSAAEIRDALLTVTSTPATAELQRFPNRVNVPGITMHPTGALLYQPFLTGLAPAAPPATGIQGGLDILDAHSGRLRLRIILPEPLATLSSDTDGLHGDFLAVDENGQRIFALTTSGLTVVELASVPLGIGTLSPSSGPAGGGTQVTIRGSGFLRGTTVSVGGKSANVVFKDMNTLTITTPATPKGPQQIIVTNPDGESVALAAAFTAH